jgi:muramoyltetrapeptide carboxypeptidase LdcA involved in peptidoglycan recycling
MKNTEKLDRNLAQLKLSENFSVVVNAEVFAERRKEEEHRKALQKILSRAAKSDW